LNKLLPLLAFSVLLLVPVGAQNVFAGAQPSQTCTLIDFEGVGNLTPPPIIIGDATFTGTVNSLVDFDQGGNGNFANEPSPDTVLVDTGSIGSSTITLTFTNPVSQVNWFYVANGATEVRFFDSGNVLFATVNAPTLNQGTVGGDPNGFFDNWNSLSFSESSNIIKKVEFEKTGASGVDYDNIEFCIMDEPKVVGGESLPIDSTALLLAATQSPASWLATLTIAALGIGAYVFTRNPSNMRNIKVILRDYLNRF